MFPVGLNTCKLDMVTVRGKFKSVETCCSLFVASQLLKIISHENTRRIVTEYLFSPNTVPILLDIDFFFYTFKMAATASWEACLMSSPLTDRI